MTESERIAIYQVAASLSLAGTGMSFTLAAEGAIILWREVTRQIPDEEVRGSVTWIGTDYGQGADRTAVFKRGPEACRTPGDADV